MGDSPQMTEQDVRDKWQRFQAAAVGVIREDGTPDRNALWKIGGCIVVGKTGSAKRPSIYVLLPDNEVYSIPLSQVGTSSICNLGQEGMLVVPGWIYLDSLFPGARSHQPTFRRKCEILGWNKGDWRAVAAPNTIPRPPHRPRRQLYVDHDWTPEAEVLVAHEKRGTKQQRGEPQPTDIPLVAPAASRPAAEVSSMAMRRLAAEERTGAALERLGDIVLCLGVAWLARNDKSDDGNELRERATSRLSRMMGER